MNRSRPPANAPSDRPCSQSRLNCTFANTDCAWPTRSLSSPRPLKFRSWTATRLCWRTPPESATNVEVSHLKERKKNSLLSFPFSSSCISFFVWFFSFGVVRFGRRHFLRSSSPLPSFRSFARRWSWHVQFGTSHCLSRFSKKKIIPSLLFGRRHRSFRRRRRLLRLW